MNKKMKTLPISRPLAVVLTTIMLAAALLAVWFFAAPTLDHENQMQQQEALLDSIASGDGLLTIPAVGISAELDFYTEGEEAPAAEIMAFSQQLPETVQNHNGVLVGIGTLSIEKIDLRLPVVESVSPADLKAAVGHLPQTPVIGEIGNALIAGHRSYRRGMFFNRLDELEPGDEIVYQPKDGTEIRFTVDEILEIEPGDPAAFVQPANQSQITLYTCTPVRTATHRLLVRATRIL